MLCATVLGIHALTATAQTPASAEPVIEAVRERVEALSAGGRLSVEGTPLSATQALATLYELHGFQQRAFSSGCIRTECPLGLAELLLANPERWNRAAIDAMLDSGTTRTIRLPKPVPVLILYWTVDRDDHGAVVFKPDPYGRDPKLLKALDRPFLRPEKAGRGSAPTPAG